MPIAPYVGIAYGTFDKRARIIGGANVFFTNKLGAPVVFDGVKLSPLLTYTTGRYQFGFVLAQNKKPGLSYNISF